MKHFQNTPYIILLLYITILLFGAPPPTHSEVNSIQKIYLALIKPTAFLTCPEALAALRASPGPSV